MASSESENGPKKGFSSKWGPRTALLAGVLGIIGSCVFLLDRFIPPNLAVCEILPVCITAPKSSDDPHVSVFGIGAIVRCRANNRPVFVSALEYSGKKTLVEKAKSKLSRERISRKSAAFGAGDCALLSHVEFILENHFEELMVRKSAGFGFLEAQIQSAKQPRETQAVRIFFEGVIRHRWMQS